MTAAMYVAVIELSSSVKVIDDMNPDDSNQMVEMKLMIQHPDQPTAVRIGTAPMSRLGAYSSLPKEFDVMLDDIKEAAERDWDNEDFELRIEEVVDINHSGAETGSGNGDAAPRTVTEIETLFGGSEGVGYFLEVTVPYNEDRYGDVYTLGTGALVKPARTNACASCGITRPGFWCSACKEELYCGRACQTKAWVSGHDKACPCS